MNRPTPQLLNLSARRLALLGERLRATPGQCFLSEPVAVVGLGCRFPGAAGPEAFWQLLLEGRDAVTDVPADRWDADAHYDPDPQAPGKSYSRRGGFLDGVDLFDAEHFGISPREARHMDPRQRILLETTREALASAGVDPARLAGSDTGVFIGHMVGDYYSLEGADLTGIDAHCGTGNLDAVLANRLSYDLDLRGPSLAVDTACSSSLVALYLACQSLRQGECQAALAGGVNLLLTPQMHVMAAKSRLLAPDGRCKTFDRSADGFVRGEGCGILVLKRYADALAAGDRVLAVIRGIAVNQDGRTNGISAPNGLAQRQVLRRALDNACLEAARVTFVETHGTGTVIGDAVEFEALAEVYGGPSAAAPCYLGAVKTNVGHLEAAAGVAGVVKMVLSLLHGRVPPNRNFREISPHLPIQATRFRLPLEVVPWAVADGPRRGAVSSFGLGGTNGHVILEEGSPAAAGVSGTRRVFFHRQRHWLPARAVAPHDRSGGSRYQLRWLSKPLEERSGGHDRGDWLIVDPNGDAGTALADRLARPGGSATAAGEFRPPAGGEYRGVVYLWTAEEGTDAPAEAEEACVGLLHLVQALGRTDSRAPLWVVTRGSQAVTGTEAVRPAPAALWGMARTVRLEHPEFPCVSVDLDTAGGDDFGDLDAEIRSDRTEAQVAYRDGRRFVARLSRCDGGGEGAPPRLREDGSYLITGGFGALGRQVARCLADLGARRLVLAGRSPPTDDPWLGEMRDCGVNLLAVRADVARPEDVARLIAICQRAAPLRGVVHAAGVADDGLLTSQTASRFATVLAPKVRGARELHVRTQHLPLDFFVVFSSAAGLLGSPGVGSYAAANAFLDALAHRRRRDGLAAVSVNWGPWADAGMGATLHARLRARGESTIDPAAALRSFARALRGPETQFGVMNVEWQRYAATYPAPEFLSLLVDRPGPAARPAPELLNRLRVAPADQRKALSEEVVRAHVAAVLGHAPAAVSPVRGLAEMGLDSLGAIELRTRLEQEFACRLPATLAFDHPTVAALAARLLERVPADRPEDGDGGPRRHGALDALSRDEIAALLASELGAPPEAEQP